MFCTLLGIPFIRYTFSLILGWQKLSFAKIKLYSLCFNRKICAPSNGHTAKHINIFIELKSMSVSGGSFPENNGISIFWKTFHWNICDWKVIKEKWKMYSCNVKYWLKCLSEINWLNWHIQVIYFIELLPHCKRNCFNYITNLLE